MLIYTINDRTSEISKFCAATDKHFLEFFEAFYKYQVWKVCSIVLKSLLRNLTPNNCWDYLNRSSLIEYDEDAQLVCQKYMLDKYTKVVESKSVRLEMEHNPALVHFFMKLIGKIHEDNVCVLNDLILGPCVQTNMPKQTCPIYQGY